MFRQFVGGRRIQGRQLVVADENLIMRIRKMNIEVHLTDEQVRIIGQEVGREIAKGLVTLLDGKGAGCLNPFTFTKTLVEIIGKGIGGGIGGGRRGIKR